jgi:hypothetical protein
MTQLARLSLLAALLVPAIGCGGEDPPVDPDPDAGVDPDANDPDPDAAPPEGTGAISFTWNLHDNGAAATCPAGAAATLVSLHEGETYRDIYDCVDGAGTAFDLPIGAYGEYTAWVEIGVGSNLVAMSESVDVVLEDGETVQTVFDIDIANGYFDVSWTIAGSSCAAVADDGVSILSTLIGTTTGLEDIFNCTDGEAPNVATTAGIPIGDYVVVASILDANQNAIGQSEEITPSIDYGNQFVLLSPLTINLF